MTRGVASKILIVDDASFMRSVLKDIIKNNGLASEIFEAADGIEGVKAFQKIKPDLVTMDVNMPRADGIQALRAILKIDPHAKVVMITSVEEKHIVVADPAKLKELLHHAELHSLDEGLKETCKLYTP